MSESEVLSYISPKFRWLTIQDGFTNRKDSATCIDNISFGSACWLEVDYHSSKLANKSSNHSTPCSGPQKDIKPAKWPVFCLLGSDLNLQGHFGDEVWSYLQFRLDPRDLNNSMPGLSKATCVPRSLADAKLHTTGVNIWLWQKIESWHQYWDNGLQLFTKPRAVRRMELGCLFEPDCKFDNHRADGPNLQSGCNQQSI
ncbi:unnamed protein product [Polarella glacialis]|uniref:Uncharacterized protein n=1 Tax=Polarella glacialis TaxID=89957 RepID=A0A813L595_POLGL|nr:unnamed protein product [Polarella glacialis]CAE8720886.1 unnamed protein product [Polarella glacialis]